MPQYRKLYTKTTYSLDFNDMPDDFTRLFWVLLPCGLSSDGTCLAHPGYIRSKVFPLRSDVTDKMIYNALGWFSAHDMIRYYKVAGHEYLWMVNFAKYQGKTDKEAKSDFPPVPEAVIKCTEPEPPPVQTYSRPTPELVQSESSTDADADADTDSEANADTFTAPTAAEPEPLSFSEPFPKEPKPAPKKHAPKDPNDPELYPLAEALSRVCAVDLKANSGRIFAEAKRLTAAEIQPTPALIDQHYGRNGWWYAEDWRGKKGQVPKPSDVRETWGQWAVDPVRPLSKMRAGLETYLSKREGVLTT